MAMWLSRMSLNGIHDNNKHLKHHKFKPCISGISQCYSFYCSNADDNRNPFPRRSYDITTIQNLVTEGLYRRDLLTLLVGSGVSHIAIKVPNLFQKYICPRYLRERL